MHSHSPLLIAAAAGLSLLACEGRPANDGANGLVNAPSAHADTVAADDSGDPIAEVAAPEPDAREDPEVTAYLPDPAPEIAAAADAAPDTPPDGPSDGALDAAADFDAADVGPEPDTGRPSPPGPPYPIVLAHGFFGFDELAGIDMLNYFWGVKDYLAEHGETVVFTPAVDPFNDSGVRALELKEKIDAILAETGYERVVVIAHSQGGLDARVIAHTYPGRIAAIFTLATPHHGSEIADIINFLVPYPGAMALIDTVTKFLGGPLWDASGEETSLGQSFKSLSTNYMKVFNELEPDNPNVAYFSVAGRSGDHPHGPECESPDEPPFIAKWHDTTDPIDILFAPMELALSGAPLDDIPNDGLVRVESAKHGIFLGCVPADHMDEVGHLFGDEPGPNNDWDHREFYLEAIRYLRQRGF